MELNGLAVKLQAECKPETCTQVVARNSHRISKKGNFMFTGHFLDSRNSHRISMKADCISTGHCPEVVTF